MDEISANRPEPLISWTPAQVALATLVVALVAGAVLLAWQFRHILVLLLLAIVLATALKPVVAWLNRLGVRWPWAANGVFGVLILAALTAVALVGPALVRESTEFLSNLPGQYQEIRERMSQRGPVVRGLVALLPEELPTWQATTQVVEGPVDEASATALGSNVGAWTAKVCLAVVIVCVLCAYWLLQEQRTLQALMLAIPRRHRTEARSLIEAIDLKVGAYVRGQFVLCAIVFALSLLAYWLIGLPQALLLAAVAGLLEAIPMLGPILGAIPALMVAAATDPSKVVGVIVATIVIQQIENYVLVPRIMDRAVGIHGFVTLLAIACFGALFGILGAILAIPLAAIVQLVIERYVLSREAQSPPQPAGRDRASRVRFELQSLIRDVRMVVRHKPSDAVDGNDALEEAIEAMALELERSLTPESTPDEEAPSCVANSS